MNSATYEKIAGYAKTSLLTAPGVRPVSFRLEGRYMRMRRPWKYIK